MPSPLLTAYLDLWSPCVHNRLLVCVFRSIKKQSPALIIRLISKVFPKMKLLPLLALLLVRSCSSYKFLVYSPLFGHSHTVFMAKIADTLAAAGHEVVSPLPFFSINPKYSDLPCPYRGYWPQRKEECLRGQGSPRGGSGSPSRRHDGRRPSESPETNLGNVSRLLEHDENGQQFYKIHVLFMWMCVL